MEWLSQNWGWLALAVAVPLLMLRRGGHAGGCCGGEHGAHHDRPSTTRREAP